MGFFSWKTSDTDKSIANVYSSRPAFKVHMITRDGNSWHESDYEGYGEFGGKDFYELVAELNGADPNRGDGIDIALGIHGVSNGEITYKAQNVDFFNWAKPIHEGKSPNELVKEGWERVHFIDENRIMPKLVENLPSYENWEEEFDALPDSPTCEYQGFFY